MNKYNIIGWRINESWKCKTFQPIFGRVVEIYYIFSKNTKSWFVEHLEPRARSSNSGHHLTYSLSAFMPRTSPTCRCRSSSSLVLSSSARISSMVSPYHWSVQQNNCLRVKWEANISNIASHIMDPSPSPTSYVYGNAHRWNVVNSLRSVFWMKLSTRDCKPNHLNSHVTSL